MKGTCCYVPDEEGFCINCGAFPADACPMTGEPAIPEGSLRAAHAELAEAWRELGAAFMATPIGRALTFLLDLVERTVNDDRS
ncbi:hypothetical protein [Devosia ginsengisoli]|uniref:hypothetical protein n=1 Tax=Devosia ginsengisoli TaxID=400770 RepID=UPI0026F18055|nr:hypothetical protein [Devosia ginsengisoli]MCR6673268.1 hypothetical protein [Devosia ginsengisoli]